MGAASWEQPCTPPPPHADTHTPLLCCRLPLRERAEAVRGRKGTAVETEPRAAVPPDPPLQVRLRGHPTLGCFIDSNLPCEIVCSAHLGSRRRGTETSGGSPGWPIVRNRFRPHVPGREKHFAPRLPWSYGVEGWGTLSAAPLRPPLIILAPACAPLSPSQSLASPHPDSSSPLPPTLCTLRAAFPPGEDLEGRMGGGEGRRRFPAKGRGKDGEGAAPSNIRSERARELRKSLPAGATSIKLDSLSSLQEETSHLISFKCNKNQPNNPAHLPLLHCCCWEVPTI